MDRSGGRGEFLVVKGFLLLRWPWSDGKHGSNVPHSVDRDRENCVSRDKYFFR